MKKVISFTLVLALGIMAASIVMADCGKCEGDNAVKKVISYPANVVKESAEVVGKAGSGTVGIVTKTAENTGAIVTGDVAKTKDLVVDPVTGSTETVGEAAKGTVEVPVKAAE